eukprot:2613605-Rhodomonas_salina.2
MGGMVLRVGDNGEREIVARQHCRGAGGRSVRYAPTLCSYAQPGTNTSSTGTMRFCVPRTSPSTAPAHHTTTPFPRSCNDYIVKPFNRLELIARISTQLRVKDALRAEVDNAKSTQLLQKMLPDH